MFLLRTHRAGNGDGGGHAAYRAARAQGRGQTLVQSQGSADEEDDPEGHQRHDRCLQQRHGPRPGDERQRQAGAQQHDAGLDEQFHPQPGSSHRGRPTVLETSRPRTSPTSGGSRLYREA